VSGRYHEEKVSATLPGWHPEPGFRWARSASLWVHLTRDDHTGGEYSKPELQEHWFQKITAR
jgi:hypothetical protein